MKVIKWIADGLFGGLMLFLLVIHTILTISMFPYPQYITFDQLCLTLLLYGWFIGWIVIYWKGLVWKIDNKAHISSWLKSKLDFFIVGFLVFSFVLKYTLINEIGHYFPTNLITFVLVFASFMYVFSLCLIKFPPRLLITLKMISFIMIWITFTFFLFLKTLVILDF